MLFFGIWNLSGGETSKILNQHHQGKQLHQFDQFKGREKANTDVFIKRENDGKQ